MQKTHNQVKEVREASGRWPLLQLLDLSLIFENTFDSW